MLSHTLKITALFRCFTFNAIFKCENISLDIVENASNGSTIFANGSGGMGISLPLYPEATPNPGHALIIGRCGEIVVLLSRPVFC